MPMTTPLVDLSHAQIARQSDGSIVINDPSSDVVIVAKVDSDRTPWRLSEITITAKNSNTRITASALSRLPISRICHLAVIGGMPPNEIFRRMMATTKRGKRQWSDDHWRQVLDVHAWAIKVKRPGGGAQAIADFWGVSRNPTAYRWLNRAKKLARLRLRNNDDL